MPIDTPANGTFKNPYIMSSQPSGSSKHGAKLAMIYSDWFPQLPETWTPLAQLHLGKPRISPADPTVTFYATGPDVSLEIEEQLKRFQPTLPPGVTLDLLITDPE